MRIAVVSPYGLDHPGGVQDQASRLVEWLQAEGHDAWLVAPGEGGPPGTRRVGGSIRVPANRSRAPVALAPGAGRRAVAAVAGADVVHLHEPFMPMVSLAVLRSAPEPLVGTFHADPGRGVLRLYQSGERVLARLAARLAVATAVSESARAALGGVVAARIVPNAVDVASYAVDVERHPHRVAFLGRDDPRKGLDVLLAAWPAIRSAVPGAELVVIGADRATAPAGVTYLGRVSEDHKRQALASAAVYCAPNLGGESFGLVVAEGMAAGCAVVASGLAAFAAVVGDAAELVPPGDADALGATLASLLGDPGRVAELAAAGRERVPAFDRPAVLAAYLEAYRDAIAARAAEDSR